MFNLYKHRREPDNCTGVQPCGCYAVVEVENTNRVHCLTWTIAQAQEWIDTVDTDKLLDDFQIVIWR